MKIQYFESFEIGRRKESNARGKKLEQQQQVRDLSCRIRINISCEKNEKEIENCEMIQKIFKCT